MTQNECFVTDLNVLDTAPVNEISIHMLPDEILPEIDVFPFTKRVWHSPAFKSDWEDTLDHGTRIHNTAEYEMVKRGHRKAATTHVTNRSFERFYEQVQADGLVYLPITRTKVYSGFSHKHFPTDADDPNSSVYGVLACDLTAARMFRDASRNGRTDHRVIGDLLGFPKCCSDFFVEVWGQGFYDPLWQAAERTEGVKYKTPNHAVVRGSVFCTQILRYIGARITSHLPCSYRCEGSIEVGRKWWEVMLAVDKEAALSLLRILSLPVNWSILHGVAVVETMPFTVWTNSMPTKSKWVIEFTPEDAFDLIRDASQP